MLSEIDFVNPTIWETILILIPIVDHPTLPKEYKVISRVLVSSKRPILSNLIDLFQRSFFPQKVYEFQLHPQI